MESLLLNRDLLNKICSLLSLKDLHRFSFVNKFLRSETTPLIQRRWKDSKLVEISSIWKLIIDFDFCFSEFSNSPSLRIVEIDDLPFEKDLSLRDWIRFLRKKRCSLYVSVDCDPKNQAWIDSEIPMFLGFSDDKDGWLEIGLKRTRSCSFIYSKEIGISITGSFP